MQQQQQQIAQQQAQIDAYKHQQQVLAQQQAAQAQADDHKVVYDAYERIEGNWFRLYVHNKGNYKLTCGVSVNIAEGPLSAPYHHGSAEIVYPGKPDIVYTRGLPSLAIENWKIECKEATF